MKIKKQKRKVIEATDLVKSPRPVKTPANTKYLTFLSEQAT